MMIGMKGLSMLSDKHNNNVKKILHTFGLDKQNIMLVDFDEFLPGDMLIGCLTTDIFGRSADVDFWVIGHGILHSSDTESDTDPWLQIGEAHDTYKLSKAAYCIIVHIEPLAINKLTLLEGSSIYCYDVTEGRHHTYIIKRLK